MGATLKEALEQLDQSIDRLERAMKKDADDKRSQLDLLSENLAQTERKRKAAAERLDDAIDQVSTLLES